MDTSKKVGSRQRTDKEKEFKGIRMRKWGRWVSEIRVPRSRSRIWLGSYDTREKAARAYDAALYCLQGAGGQFNIPTNERPDIPDRLRSSLTKSDIKDIARSFTSPSASPLPSSNCMSMSPGASSVSSSSSVPVGWSESQLLSYSGNDVACETGLLCTDGGSGPSVGLDEFLLENLMIGGPTSDSYSCCLWDLM